MAIGDVTPFDNAAPGTDTRRTGNYFSRPAAAEINAGQAVTLDANGEFKPVQAVDASLTSPTWDAVAGIAYTSAAAGEKVTVKTNGAVIARIDATNVSGGSTCGTSSGSTSSAKGELSADGDEYFAVRTKTATDDDGNTQDYAEVLKK